MKLENNSRQLLRNYGLKVTGTRLQVLEILMNSPVALSHSDIISKIDDHAVDKVTLYRTLNAFTECGLAHKVATENRNWLYALHFHNGEETATSDDHPHFICDRCKRIYCLPSETVALNPVIHKEQGFVITSHEYRMHGLCPECN